MQHKKTASTVLFVLLATLAARSQPALANEEYFADFGFVHINTTQFLNYQITNDGPGPMKLKTFEVSGFGFSADSNCDQTVPVHGTCQLEIQFNPTIEGLQSGELVLGFEKDTMTFDLQGTGQR